MAAQWGPSMAKRAAMTKYGSSRQARFDAEDRRTGAKPKPDVQMMLPVGHLQRPEPHQQTPEQFANDPRSWWHGRYAHTGKTGKGGARLAKTGTDEGFHAGSKASAIKRLEANYGRGRRDDEGNHAPGRLYPTRLVGQMGSQIHRTQTYGGADYDTGLGATPFAPTADRPRHKGLGQERKGYFYRNDVEDPGHVSVGVPKREGYLATHLDTIKAAQERGEYVHPMIAWAAKQHDHTGQDVMSYRQHRYNMPQQHSFAQAIHETPLENFAGHQYGERSASNQRWHESQSFNPQRVDREWHEVQTEGGEMKRVVKYASPDWRRDF